MSILSLTAVQLGQKIKEKEISVREAVEASLEQIGKLDSALHCYVTTDRKKALEQAEHIQKRIDEGTLTGPLAGVPAALKDNLCTEGMLTTCSSNILGNFVPTYTA